MGLLFNLDVENIPGFHEVDCLFNGFVFVF